MTLYDGMVISIVAKESLGDAIGGTVRSLGSVVHQRLPAGGSFPHTEHQRQLAGGFVRSHNARGYSIDLKA